MRPGTVVDKRLARLIAMKRIVTGAASIAGGIILGVVGSVKGAPPMLYLGIAIFFFTGAWSLRDGLRLRRAIDRAP